MADDEKPNVYDPPDADLGGFREGPDDPTVLLAAQASLQKLGISAVVAAFLSWLCNPLLVVSLIAIGAGIEALRRPGKLRLVLGEDYPEQAGKTCQVLGGIALVVAGLRILAIGVLLLAL